MSMVKLQIEKEIYYLVSLFPCKWSDFPSMAHNFPDIESAKNALDASSYRLRQSLGDNERLLKSATITIETYEDGKCLQSVNYKIPEEDTK